ncbi:MAG: LemA family protein [Sulfurovum sp.]|nr:LemA family protein [Sulfurovum sp.]
MSGSVIVLLVIMAAMGYLIVIYNRFAALRAGIDASWADIEVQLKRRYDLIPALVEVVKSYKSYEAKTLEDIVRVRQEALGAGTVGEKYESAGKVAGALGSIFALAEAYPDLKANTNFLKLQNELSSLENALHSARRYYNAIVRDYNYRLESFPDMWIAKRFNYHPYDYFELTVHEAEKANQMPKIDLS